VTGGTTNQWGPADLAGGATAYVDASYATPGRVTLAAGGPAQTLEPAPLPATFPRTLVRPKAIVFSRARRFAIHGQLFVPAGAGKHPALIFVHGGPERQMLTTFHYFEAYANLYELNQYFVSRGFEVLSVNYRSGIMYGHDFYEAPKRGWLGASEYQDVLAGARFSAPDPEVDPRRLGIYGLSYGGYLTALALARNSDVFAAGADQAGVHDWRAIIDQWSGHPVGTPEQRAIAYASSPMASLDRWRSPVYLSQGDDDRNVPFRSRRRARERARSPRHRRHDLRRPRRTTRVRRLRPRTRALHGNRKLPDRAPRYALSVGASPLSSASRASRTATCARERTPSLS
jgi:dipeptidyl aminopeptidase/acylaminoacyl peptidase